MSENKESNELKRNLNEIARHVFNPTPTSQNDIDRILKEEDNKRLKEWKNRIKDPKEIEKWGRWAQEQ